MPETANAQRLQQLAPLALRPLRITLGLAAVLVLLLIVGGTFLDDRSAQILAGLLTAMVTTLVSVLATYHASISTSTQGAKEELTRYGLLAWRNLDSLQLKVNQQLDGRREVTSDTLREWLLDLDQAKWAWQDILREVFLLQERLQAETYELAKDFREKARSASPDELTRLQVEHEAQLAKLASSSPLPLRVPGEVFCPYCNARVTAVVGNQRGETRTMQCPACTKVFHAHRAGDGTLFSRKHGGATAEDRRVWTAVVVEVFTAAPAQVLRGGWEEFYQEVEIRLSELGRDPSQSLQLQRWLFNKKAFRLLGPGNGIGLVVPAADLTEYLRGQQPLAGRAAAPEGVGAEQSPAAQLQVEIP